MRTTAVVIAAFALGACAHRAGHDDVSRARVALAEELLRKGEWRQTVEVLGKVHSEREPTARTLTARGTALRELKAYDEAERDLLRAIRLSGRHAPAHAALAVLYDLRGRYGPADEHHGRAIDLDDQNAQYWNDWGFSFHLRRADDKAIEAFRMALELDPGLRRARNNLGFSYARVGDFTRAAQQFALGGSPAEAKNNLGFAYEAAGRLTQARDAYREAMWLDPTLRQARGNFAGVVARLEGRAPSGAGAGGKAP